MRNDESKSEPRDTPKPPPSPGNLVEGELDEDPDGDEQGRAAKIARWFAERGPQNAAEWIIAVATVVYVVVAASQLSALRDTNDLTRRAVENAERSTEVGARAWVTVKSIQTLTLSTKEAPGSAVVIVENGGKSPASGRIVNLSLIYDASERLLDDPLGQIPPNPDWSHFVVGPGQTHYNPVALPVFRPGDWTRILEGKRVFVVLGRIEYEDGFKHKRLTVFCQRLRPPDTWSQCSTNNTAD